jgi:hypothetical protein
MLDLQQLLEEQQQTNPAIMALLKEGLPSSEAPDGTRSLGEELDQNARLLKIRETQGETAWRSAHNAVMRERRAKMRRQSRVAV